MVNSLKVSPNQKVKAEGCRFLENQRIRFLESKNPGMLSDIQERKNWDSEPSKFCMCEKQKFEGILNARISLKS